MSAYPNCEKLRDPAFDALRGFLRWFIEDHKEPARDANGEPIEVAPRLVVDTRYLTTDLSVSGVLGLMASKYNGETWEQTVATLEGVKRWEPEAQRLAWSDSEIDRLLYAYFGVDPVELENERRAMIEALRKK